MGNGIEVTVSTMGGVVKASEKPGTVTIELGETANVAALTVVDGDGQSVTVYLNHRPTVHLMGALGAASMRM